MRASLVSEQLGLRVLGPVTVDSGTDSVTSGQALPRHVVRRLCAPYSVIPVCGYASCRFSPPPPFPRGPVVRPRPSFNWKIFRVSSVRVRLKTPFFESEINQSCGIIHPPRFISASRIVDLSEIIYIENPKHLLR